MRMTFSTFVMPTRERLTCGVGHDACTSSWSWGMTSAMHVKKIVGRRRAVWHDRRYAGRGSKLGAHDGFQIKAQPLAVAAANRQSNGEYGTEAKSRPSGLHCVSKEYGVERQARWCSTTGRGTRGTVSRGRGTARTRRRGPRARLL